MPSHHLKSFRFNTEIISFPFALLEKFQVKPICEKILSNSFIGVELIKFPQKNNIVWPTIQTVKNTEFVVQGIKMIGQLKKISEEKTSSIVRKASSPINIFTYLHQQAQECVNEDHPRFIDF